MNLLSVAQFRRIFLRPTETFIYNYLSAFENVNPVVITFKRENEEKFPYSAPLVELYGWNIWQRGWRKIQGGFAQSSYKRFDSHLRYHLPQTFQTIKEYEIKVFHAHFGYTGHQVLPVKDKINLPLVTTFYGEDLSALPRLDYWQKAYQELFKVGELFLVEGKFMKQKLVNLGCPSEKVEIQKIAIYPNKYPYHIRQAKSKKEPIRILFCGSFREKKGLIYALEAVYRAYQTFQNLEFYIIGDGELRPQIEEMISHYQMNAYTHLLGFQPHQRMIEEMNQADLFIHPSVTAVDGDSEGGAPTTILEAQACGLPILSTTHADIPNIVVPNKSALLSPEKDTDTLYENLMLLLNEQERWSSMSQEGRTWIDNHYNISQEVINLEKRYYRLASVNYP